MGACWQFLKGTHFLWVFELLAYLTIFHDCVMFHRQWMTQESSAGSPRLLASPGDPLPGTLFPLSVRRSQSVVLHWEDRICPTHRQRQSHHEFESTPRVDFWR